MKTKILMRGGILGAFIAAILIKQFDLSAPNVPEQPTATPNTEWVHVDQPPVFSAAASWGKTEFEAHCASCHGQDAAGTDIGPPLIHTYYRESHHPDASFYSAVAYGVEAHHWGFGNMPSLGDRVGTLQTSAIIAYIRELQAQNGIF